MLSHQQRRRRHHRDLASAHRNDEGRAQRHLGLAKADITTDQPVHRTAARQIAEHILDRIELVIGLGEREGRTEFVPGAVFRHDRVGGARQAFGGDLDQRIGHVAQAFLGLGLARLPGNPAELVEMGRIAVGAIARQQFDILDRQI